MEKKLLSLIILGGESLGREAAEIAGLQGHFQDIRFLDDKCHHGCHQIQKISVVGPFSDWPKYVGERTSFFVAVGKSHLREQLNQAIAARNGHLTTLIHPGACISSLAKVARGCLINYGCHVGPNAEVGEGSIFWSGVTISHDCKIGAYCFFSPGVSVGGYTRIGRNCLIGINVGIRSDISIGKQCAISMGNIITKNVEDLYYIKPNGKVMFLEDKNPEGFFFKDHSLKAVFIDQETHEK
jgi:sugar O-acyltransferase (sialic acid O-acetyltransferase NeuD family)